MSANAMPIAIVGIAAELPGGPDNPDNLNHGQFFDFLLSKGQAYDSVPEDRFNYHAVHGSALGQVLPMKGSFLKNLELFDHIKFGITSTDARHMAISTRKLVELTFLALLDSSIDYRGWPVGCYAAGVSHDVFALSGQDEHEACGSFAGLPSMIANRVSYHLDLRGPSVPVDTACSSSLTALHLAMQGIRAGDCETAVVGGVQLNLRMVDWVNYSQGGIVSADGRCKPFDAGANGFARGEGGVVIVLKPLHAAIRDGDHVYGSVLGSAINSAGSLAPVSAPVAIAQQRAMEAAFQHTGRCPQDVDFLELHATGTAKGDPTEANWAGSWFQRDEEILLGSVKGNIGHLEITAFLASLSKVLSIFETGLIPPNVNLEVPNPAIKWSEYRLRVPTEVTPLPKRNRRTIVAMTSSGIGGANGSAVVESPPTRINTPSPGIQLWATNPSCPRLFVCGGLSPRTAAAVSQSIEALRHDGVDEQTVQLTYARCARSMPWISYAITSGSNAARFSEPVLVLKDPGPLVYVFSGQGPQHFDMGCELFRSSVVFRESILECDTIYERMTGHSLIVKYGLFGDSHHSHTALGDIWPIAVTLPSLTFVQIALFDTLKSLGLTPDVVIGHSAGETAVLYASGAASKEMTVELSIARGRGLTPLEDLECSMAALNCSLAKAESVIAQVLSELATSNLEIGCYNSTDTLTLSGGNAELDHMVYIATSKGMFARQLKTRVAVHSSMMEHCREVYCSAVASVYARHKLALPIATIYSSATGEIMQTGGNADYFWVNSRGPVRFQQAIQAITKTYPNAAYIELGPHPVLASYLSSLLGTSANVTCPLRRPNPKKSESNVELRAFLDAIGRMATVRHHVDYSLLVGTTTTVLRNSPAYPFQKKIVPTRIATQEIKRFTRARNGPLNFPELRINLDTHPSLADHIIKSASIMPAAGYVEMALEFGARKIWNISFYSMLGLAVTRPTPVVVQLKNSHWTIKSASSHSETTHDDVCYDRLHAEGHLSTHITEAKHLPSPLEVEAVRSRCRSFDVSRFYADIKYFADYGQDYRRITALYFNEDEALVEIVGLTEEMQKKDPRYILHPAIFDAAIHPSIHHAMTSHCDTQIYYLPVCIRSLVVHDALLEGIPEKIISHIVRTSWSPTLITFDCVISTVIGTKLVSVEGLGLERHGTALIQAPTWRYNLDYVPTGGKIHRTTAPNYLHPSTEAIAPLSFVYNRGEEMLVQKAIGELQTWQHQCIWFISDTSNSGVFGFTRSLRREYMGWTIRLVVFDATWSAAERGAAILHLQALQDQLELEVLIDTHGRVCVPRLVPMVQPSSSVAFDPLQTWVVERGQVVHIDPPFIPANDDTRAVVQILALSRGVGSLREFIGFDFATNHILMGVISGPLSNVALIYREACVRVSDLTAAMVNGMPPLLAAVIVALALGLSAFAKSAHLQPVFRNAPVLVTHAETPVGRAVCDIMVALHIKLVPLSSSYDLSSVRPCHSALILSGYDDESANGILSHALTDNGRLFAWNSSVTGVVATLRTQPWIIGNALRCALSSDVLVNASNIYVASPSTLVVDVLDQGHQVTSACRLFTADKTYVLIGGTGSLGVDVAEWLYENGARSIVLTSRTGRQKFVDRADAKAIHMLAYLESLPDLDLRLAAVDATSVSDMTAMFQDIKSPIGGCMILSGILIDRPFARQDEESFDIVFRAKTGVVTALEQSIAIESLDWLLAFTSISGFFGSAGQTNYASANTAMDGLIHRYRNAFSLVVPLIIDSSVAMEPSRMRHLTTWAYTARELCLCIRDGICQLRSHTFGLYVPDFDWVEVGSRLGVDPCFQNLIGTAAQIAVDSSAKGQSIEGIVVQHLDLVLEDLARERPLTSYGLDSLSAARLSVALRHHTCVTQLQLLGDMTINDLYQLAETDIKDSTKPDNMLFDWVHFHNPGQTLVRCIDPNAAGSQAVPLILMHGTSGSGAAFSPLQSSFRTPLWFLQTTTDTPFSSMDVLVAFYISKIRANRPCGPYRIGVFCATCIIAVELVRALEAQGDEAAVMVSDVHVSSSYWYLRDLTHHNAWTSKEDRAGPHCGWR